MFEIRDGDYQLIYRSEVAVTLREAVAEAIAANLSLDYAALNMVDLSEMDLSGARLTRVILCGADLSGADLSGANLSGAFLVKFEPANAEQISDMELYYGITVPSVLPPAVLAGANLSGAILDGAYLEGADLSGADLSGVDLRLGKATPNLYGVNFSRADLSGKDLHGANMGEACFAGAKLMNTNLHDVFLAGADFSGADLRGSNLSYAYLASANDLGENLPPANLSGANLHGADLTGARLAGVSLRQANLTASNLDQADLTGADTAFTTGLEEALEAASESFKATAGLWLMSLITAGARGAEVVAFDSMQYVPGDLAAMVDVRTGYDMTRTFGEFVQSPPALLMPLSPLASNVDTSIFSMLFVVSDPPSRLIKLESISALQPTTAEAARLRSRDSSSPWARARLVAERHGVELVLRATRGNVTTVSVEQSLNADSLTTASRLTHSEVGSFTNHPIRRQLETFAQAVAEVSDELASVQASRSTRAQAGMSAGQGQYVSPATSGSSGGCFVATAVYGSYDCREVRVLRRWRDSALCSSAPGRMLVRAYYAVSPHLVDAVGETVWFVATTRKLLDGLVARLTRSGISDAPYRDLQP